MQKQSIVAVTDADFKALLSGDPQARIDWFNWMFKSLPAPVAIFNQCGVTYANDKFIEETGLNAGDVKAGKFSIFSIEESGIADAAKRALRGETVVLKGLKDPLGCIAADRSAKRTVYPCIVLSPLSVGGEPEWCEITFMLCVSPQYIND